MFLEGGGEGEGKTGVPRGGGERGKGEGGRRGGMQTDVLLQRQPRAQVYQCSAVQYTVSAVQMQMQMQMRALRHHDALGKKNDRPTQHTAQCTLH